MAMLRLPSRYEDLDEAFRGRLRVNRELIDTVKIAIKSIKISGGVRFFPIYGLSGSGKSCAAREISTHLPETHTVTLPRNAIENGIELRRFLHENTEKGCPTIIVIDQYEEVASGKTDIPSRFIENISILDRDREFLVDNIYIFLWLTTDAEFRNALVAHTSRNRRILQTPDFIMTGPDKAEWPSVMEETFRFHNGDKPLSDFEIIDNDLIESTKTNNTLGEAIIDIATKLYNYTGSTHDLSEYKVIMLWPVTDGLRISRVTQFSDPRQGYKLDWNAWYRQLNKEDQAQLPLKEYNKTRLYFDIRIVPIAAADIEPFCRNLDEDAITMFDSHLERFKNTHFVQILSSSFSPDSFAPMRERASQRAETARIWYSTVTNKPTQIGKRIAQALTEINLASDYEKTIESTYNRVRADVFHANDYTKFIVEMKCYSAENTMPSTICDAIKTTLRRHAQFAGFIQRQ